MKNLVNNSVSYNTQHVSPCLSMAGFAMATISQVAFVRPNSFAGRFFEIP